MSSLTVCNLWILVRNLLAIEEFGSKNLEPLKQKGAYPYEYMDSFKRFHEEKLPDKECFFSSTKKRKEKLMKILEN